MKCTFPGDPRNPLLDVMMMNSGNIHRDKVKRGVSTRRNTMQQRKHNRSGLLIWRSLRNIVKQKNKIKLVVDLYIQ